MSRGRWLVLVLVAILAWQGWDHFRAPASVGDATAAAAADALPREARETLRLIERGGPFPYERDGIVFNNFERRLPDKPRGYYHEYTVPAPGERSRGARRIITGGTPPEVFYYTDDHYESFRQIGGSR